MAPRLAVVTDLPTPYRAPLFDAIAARGRVDLHVLYLAQGETGRASWRVDCSGHPHTFLAGGAVTFRARKGPFAWKWNVGIGRRLSEIAPDVISVGGWAHPAMHLAMGWARRRGVPYLVTSESHPRRHGLLRARAKAFVAGRAVRGAAGWLPVSSRAQDLLVSLGADPARCRLVPNAPDARRFAAARADVSARAATRARLGVGAEPVTLFVGRLIPAKGLATLLDAARLLAPRTPRLFVVGAGPLSKRLAGAMTLLGERGYDEIVALQAAADVSVLPSIHEPYGVALHEGMAAGCAGLASDAVGAAADLVEDGVTGRTFPAGDAAALVAAWSDLLADPARLQTIGAAASRRAIERGLDFTVEQTEAAAIEAASVHTAARAR